ncbi:sulfotransferase family protein [Nitrososphaera viennensis]|uniref:Sulfotransferase n=1 Tax=Nitrososphaera viennensis TaxID=1034015 RepID=A0A977ICQ7_9ARCH|nr:sulfotransferase [Nitrososphaera viennensis]UVS68367.1 sulfotransferase [Nitrososphaera viennensis]
MLKLIFIRYVLRDIVIKSIWPNFFIVGAHKGGTTSLYEYLTQVPDIYMSKMKEPHFFAPNVQPTSKFPYKVIRSEQKYLDLFKDGETKLAVGEASTSYLWDPKSPHLISEKIPNAKIIMILRDPVTRAFSHYLMSFRGGVETLPFYDALVKDYALQRKGFGISNLYIELGFYSEQVKKYLEIFGKENVKILIFEEFIQNTEHSVIDTLKFLRIQSKVPNNIDTAYNSFFVPRNNLVLSLLRNRAVSALAGTLPTSLIDWLRGNKLLFKKTGKPQISAKERQFLTEIYRDDVAALSSILGRRLPWTCQF